MTKKEKQLLLKDLCARLPYGVKVLADIDKTFDGGCIGIINKIEPYVGNKFPELKGQYLLYEKDCLTPLVVDEVRPYLRPMSSMTMEEIEEYRNLSDEVIGSYGPYHHGFIAHCVRLGIKPDNPHECVDDFLNMEAIDWLLSHYFDFRGLISKGLALEAPKDMYKND